MAHRDLDQWIQEIGSGQTLEGIATQAGLTRQRIHQILQAERPEALKQALQQKRRQGRRNRMSQAARILEMQNQGLTYQKIAEREGMSAGGVQNLLNRAEEENPESDFAKARRIRIQDLREKAKANRDKDVQAWHARRAGKTWKEIAKIYGTDDIRYARKRVTHCLLHHPELFPEVRWEDLRRLAEAKKERQRSQDPANWLSRMRNGATVTEIAKGETESEGNIRRILSTWHTEAYQEAMREGRRQRQRNRAAFLADTVWKARQDGKIWKEIADAAGKSPGSLILKVRKYRRIFPELFPALPRRTPHRAKGPSTPKTQKGAS